MVLYTSNHTFMVIFWALWVYIGSKLTQKGSILTLFELKYNFLTQLFHISSKHFYMVLYTYNHAPTVIFWGFMALS